MINTANILFFVHKTTTCTNFSIFCAYFGNVHKFFDFLCISKECAQLFHRLICYQPPEPPLCDVPELLPPLLELLGGMYCLVVCVETKVSRLMVSLNEFGTS